MRRLRSLLLPAALLLSACASDDRPPCRRVTAEQFMRPHPFKGIPSDVFIGVSGTPGTFPKLENDARAFKQVWEMGLLHNWAVLWCPVAELPPGYLQELKNQAQRRVTHRGRD